MEPIIEYSRLSRDSIERRNQLGLKLRQSAANHLDYAERMVELRSLAEADGDDELVRLADEKLAELSESAGVLDEVCEAEGIEL